MQKVFTCLNNHYVPEPEPVPEPDTTPSCFICREPAEELIPRSRLLSHSFVSDLRTCERYAYFRRFLHLRPKTEYTIAVDAGSLWHVGMRAWHTTRGSKEFRLETAKTAVLRGSDKYPTFPHFPEKTDIRSIDSIFTFLERYADHYGERDNFEVMEVEGIRTDETRASVILSGEGYENALHVSILDLVAKMRDGSYCIVDFKSTRLLTKGTLASYRMSHQFTGYLYTVRQLTGLPITRIIIDVVGWFKNFDPIRHFQRVYTSRTPQQIDNWKEQMLRQADNWEQLKSTGAWDQNTRSCGAWNQPCPYIDPCFAWKTPIMNSMLTSEYKVVRDDQPQEQVREWEQEEFEEGI